MEITDFPKLNLSNLPTPLTRLERISQYLNHNIYIKRDDLTGFCFGGNKTRKLDYLIAEAVEKGYDSLIAVGAYQSNFCRMAAGAGTATGLEVHLVLGGAQDPAKATGNLLLNTILGVTIHKVYDSDWDVWTEAALSLQQELIDSGKKPYYLPIGGSVPVGVLGYINGLKEILDQSKRMGIEIDKIIHASSSGGTQAGLVLGKQIYKWPGEIIGIGVAKNEVQLNSEIRELCNSTSEMLGFKFNNEGINVDCSYIGDEYGARTDEASEAIELFAQKEGIFLDNVYTGKAAAGLIDYAKKNRFKQNENILFLHTGGNIELFE